MWCGLTFINMIMEVLLMSDDNTFEYENSKDKKCREAVCIDAQRVYDSCGDKDCLSDLRVYFSKCNQDVVDRAANVRLRDADVMTVLVDIEPLPFHRGFYSIDLTFFFNVCIDCFVPDEMQPTLVEGLCISTKKVILYGSEGNVKVFSSELSCDEYDKQKTMARNLPLATVQVARPVALSAKLCCDCDCCCSLPLNLPNSVKSKLGEDFAKESKKKVLATIGVFSIVQMQRNVQMLIHAYDFCIPEKKCHCSNDNPCEVFSKLDFPTNDFFPPNVDELTGNETSTCDFGCSSCGNS